MLAALLILFAAAIPTTLAAEARQAVLPFIGCNWVDGNETTPYNITIRKCALDLARAPDNFDKVCTNRNLLAFANDCPQPGSFYWSKAGVTFNWDYSPECWAKQCSVLPEYLSCYREHYRGNNTDYHAGAYQLMEACSLRGYDVTTNVGNVRSSAMVVGVPATAVILGAAAVCAFM